MKIQIEARPFAELKDYAGTYSANKEFDFTLVIQVYIESDVKYVQEIVWEGKKPKNYRQVEKQIEAYWKALN